MADVKTEKKFASLETAKKINDDVASLKEDIGDLNSSIDSIKEIGLSSKVNFSTGGLDPSMEVLPIMQKDFIVILSL